MENTLKKRTNKKGFTLVELVIVIAILAILAAIAVPTVTNVIAAANANTDAANVQTVEMAIKSAYAERVSGTWDGKFKSTDTAISADDLTIEQALKHQGLTLPTAKVADATWQYKNGKLYLQKETVTDGTSITASTTKVKDATKVS